MDERGTFVRNFLTQVQSVLGADNPRTLVSEVRAICERFQNQARGDPRVVIVPYAFWLNFAAEFAEAYLGTDDEADLLEVARSGLIRQIRNLAVNHHMTEVLNDD